MIYTASSPFKVNNIENEIEMIDNIIFSPNNCTSFSQVLTTDVICGKCISFSLLLKVFFININGR